MWLRSWLCLHISVMVPVAKCQLWNRMLTWLCAPWVLQTGPPWTEWYGSWQGIIISVSFLLYLVAFMHRSCPSAAASDKKIKYGDKYRKDLPHSLPITNTCTVFMISDSGWTSAQHYFMQLWEVWWWWDICGWIKKSVLRPQVVPLCLILQDKIAAGRSREHPVKILIYSRPSLHFLSVCQVLAAGNYLDGVLSKRKWLMFP